MQTRRVGLVRLRHLEPPDEEASFDGFEGVLADLFERPQREVQPRIDAMLADAPDWLTTYHLSPQRRLLLSWYPFDPGSTVVEIGAGCGALTGLLTERTARVIANEKFPVRATVIARRYSDRPNLEVLVGSVEQIELDEPVDYVTCIGVLEYAGQFLGDTTRPDYTRPFADFLAKAASLLKPGGRLLLAIENKLGLQYFAGADEDHRQGAFASIEGYPRYAGIRTFSRSELEDLLAAAGFVDRRFFLPFPNYKLPHVVLHEDAIGELSPAVCADLFVGIPPYHPRTPLFDEHLLADGLLRDGLLDRFANSFLVEARREDPPGAR